MNILQDPLNGMQIRAYHPDDFETLYQMDQACFPPGVSYSRQELAGFIGHRLSKTWVACSENVTMGFLILEKEPQQAGHIVTIDVTSSHRRGGVGTRLMDAAEGWAAERGLRLIYLETAKENRVAQFFYATRGYAKVREIAGYYADGGAAWVMVKWLKDPKTTSAKVDATTDNARSGQPEAVPTSESSRWSRRHRLKERT